MINYLDLFSGIGGFALGAYWAGMKFDNHYFSDIEKFPIELYQKRFPDAIALGDITKINTKKLPKGKWIISGGFPCQDISNAGNKKGLIDEEGNKTRSGLWFDYARIIDELQPQFAIMENVGALLNNGIDEVLGSLAKIGYDAEWQDIQAADMGAPHKRERIWIIAYPSSIGRFQSSFQIRNTFKTIKNRGCPIERIYSKALSKNAYSRNFRKYNDLPGTMDRLKGLGNAIVPQIAELLFKQIKPYVYNKEK